MKGRAMLERVTISFARTYEGLKLGHRVRVGAVVSSFARTYEGLKPFLPSAASPGRAVLPVPMRD